MLSRLARRKLEEKISSYEKYIKGQNNKIDNCRRLIEKKVETISKLKKQLEQENEE